MSDKNVLYIDKYNKDYWSVARAIHSKTIHEIIFKDGLGYEDLSKDTQKLIALHSPIENVVEGDITLCNKYPNQPLSYMSDDIDQIKEDIDYFKRKLDKNNLSPKTRERIEKQIAILEDCMVIYKV